MSSRRLRRALLLLTLLATLPAVAGAQANADSTEQALIELRLGRFLGQTVPAYRIGDSVLVPLGAFLDMAEIQHHYVPGGGLEAVMQPGNVRFSLGQRWDTLVVGRQAWPLAGADRLYRSGEIYLGTRVLEQALGLRIIVNWSDLLVVVANAEILPVGRRLEREAARRALAGLDTGLEPDLTLGLDRERWGGMVLDYSILSPANDALGGGSYSAALGLDLLGGSLEISNATEGTLDQGRTRTDVSWTGVWRRSTWLSQIRLGDGVATGPRPRSIRGFSLSNAPYQRPSVLGAASFNGQLGPGWQVEAYRGGRLIGFDSVNAFGDFSLDVPVQYGENPVDFVAYGPFGEVRRFNRTYNVRGDLLPYRSFEYGVAAGACRTPVCRSSANLDLRYGVARRWTVQAGFDQFWRDSLDNLSHPYAGVTGSLGNAWGVELEGVANAVLRSALHYEPSTNLRVSLEYNDFARSVVQPILTPSGRRSQWTAQGFYRPGSRNGDLYFEGSLDQISADAGNFTSGRLGLSLQAAEVRFYPSVRLARVSQAGAGSHTDGFFGINAIALPRPSLGALLGAVSARVALETEASLHATSASAYLSRPVGAGLRIETGLSWMRHTGTTFAFSISTNLRSVRAYSTVNAGATGTNATTYLQGSVLYNPDHRSLSLASGPALQRSGVAGQVFLDENGNGNLDEGEQLLPDVRVRVGMITTRTDSLGRYRIWDLLPYEPVILVVDTLTLQSPLWIPTFAAVSIEPGPNEFRTVNVPIAPGGVVEGQVVRRTPTGPTGMGGITLVLRDLNSGAERRLLTYSDGGFYAIGVKPGEYEITLPDRLAERLGMAVRPVRFILAPSVDGTSVSGLEVELSEK